MHDLLCLFCAPENKIIILRAVISRILSAHFRKKLPAYHQEMADIIIRPQQIHAEVRLEMRLKILA